MSSSDKRVVHLRRLNDFYHATIETYFELKSKTKEEFTEWWMMLSKPAVESIEVSVREMYRWHWVKPKKKDEKDAPDKERTIDLEFEPVWTFIREFLQIIVPEYERISSSTFDNLTPIQITRIISGQEPEDLATSLAS